MKNAARPTHEQKMKKQEKRRRKIRQRKEDARLNRRITARLLGVDVARLSEVRKQTSTYTRERDEI